MRFEIGAIQSIFQKPMRAFINPTIGLCVQLPNYPLHFIENLILPFDKSKDNTHAIPHLSAMPSTLSEAHSRHPLISLLCPLRAATSLSVVEVSCLCHPSTISISNPWAFQVWCTCMWMIVCDQGGLEPAA